MIANITIANRTNSPIWSNGAIALIIDFKTTCKPEIQEKYISFQVSVYLLKIMKGMQSGCNMKSVSNMHPNNILFYCHKWSTLRTQQMHSCSGFINFFIFNFHFAKILLKNSKFFNGILFSKKRKIISPFLSNQVKIRVNIILLFWSIFSTYSSDFRVTSILHCVRWNAIFKLFTLSGIASPF